MLYAVLIPFLLAIFTVPIYRMLKTYTCWVFAFVAAGIFLYLASYIPQIANSEIFYETRPWVSSLGIELSFYLDGLSLIFALLISGIGVLIIIYTGAYLKDDVNIHRFYLALLAFMGSMLGVVLSGNLITLFIFWELTSITSYLLIGYDHQKQETRTAALQALLVTGGGGLALLAGFILIGYAAGTYDIPTILMSGDLLREHANYTAILLLLLAGAFTKSAQFPFHFWLPNAMAAPTPASAYLHSSTMVKAGLYLMARIHPVLGDTNLWYNIVVLTGGITLIASAYLAVRQVVLKKLLAYTTISALGLITVCLGIGTPYALKAAMTFLLVHALYKASMFMVAGSISHSTHVYDTEKLGGLGRIMPLTAVTAALAALSMAGLPPFLGFIGKETLYEAGLAAPGYSVWITTAMVLAAAVNLFVAFAVAWRPFWSPFQSTPHKAHEGSFGLWLGPMVLGLLGLFLGLFPAIAGKYLVTSATAATAGYVVSVQLIHWHGFNTALMLSIFTFGLGFILFLFRQHLRSVLSLPGKADWLGPEATYHRLVDGMLWLAKKQTCILQNGYLRYYLFCVILFLVMLPIYTLLSGGGIPIPNEIPEVKLYELGIALMIICAAIGATRTRSRLTAVVCLGAVGYGVSLVYIFYGAPDLAMTQFVIETLTVLIFVLVLYRLPRFTHFTSEFVKFRDMVLAGFAGAFITILIIAALRIEIAPTISDYFAENSASKAYGRNIVNVILVDFRSLDTLGEILVLSIAAIGAFGLLRLTKVEKKNT